MSLLFFCKHSFVNNPVPGRGDGFALADRAAAGGAQTVSFFKGEAAALALGWFHREPLRVRGPGDVPEMIQNLPLPNPE